MLFTSPVVVVLTLLFMFFLLSFYVMDNVNQMSIFECGYKSYFFSRFSFSIHFFFISILFLFLDLEICITILMLLESSSMEVVMFYLVYFVSFLLLSLYLEWFEKKLDWMI